MTHDIEPYAGQQRHQFSITFFEDMYPTKKGEALVDLQTLADEIGRKHAGSKDQLPWLKLSKFGDTPNAKGYLRYNENVLSVTGLELDYDAGTLSFDEAVEIAEKAGLQCLIYTSPSNLTEGKHKWRILCPLEEEVDPIQRDHLMGRVNGLYGGIFDPASWTLSQSYYYGYVDGNSVNHHVEVVDGSPVDTMHELDEIWRPKPLHSARFDGGSDTAYRRHAYQEGQFNYDMAADAIRTGKNYHNALLSLIAHMAARGSNRDEILERIRGILDSVPSHLRDHRYKARSSLRHLNGIMDWVLIKENTRFVQRARESDHVAKEKAQKGPRLLSESEALAHLQPQDWLIHDVMERGYLYALTARSGSGKTAVALMMAYQMAAQDIPSRYLGSREVEPGNVVFLAGENPADLVRRMAGFRAHHGLKAQASLAVVMGTFSIRDNVETLTAQIPKDRPISLVVVDTAQSFFPGSEENSNAEMLAYAQTLRQLTKLPGNPCVLVLCHPAKFAAAQADLLPRGGSSFLGEIDGNLTLWSDGDGDKVFELHHTDKLRGPGFEPIKIEMIRYTDPGLVDTKGRPSYTVIASVVSEQEAESRADEYSERQQAIIDALGFAKEGLRHGALSEVTMIPKATVTRLLRDLMARPPRVEKAGSIYRLVKLPKKNGKVSDDK